MRSILLMLVVLACCASAKEKDTSRPAKKQNQRMAAELAVEVARAELTRMQDVFEIIDPDMDSLDVMVSSPAKNGQFLRRYSDKKKHYLKCLDTLHRLEERSQ